MIMISYDFNLYSHFSLIFLYIFTVVWYENIIKLVRTVHFLLSILAIT